jgi:hypothetical protein
MTAPTRWPTLDYSEGLAGQGPGAGEIRGSTSPSARDSRRTLATPLSAKRSSKRRSPASRPSRRGRGDVRTPRTDHRPRHAHHRLARRRALDAVLVASSPTVSSPSSAIGAARRSRSRPGASAIVMPCGNSGHALLPIPWASELEKGWRQPESRHNNTPAAARLATKIRK